MPRKAKSTSPQPPTPEPQVQATPGLVQDPALSPIRRDPKGRFATGNAGGPGNPHARHCARVLAFFRNAIDDEKIEAIVQVLYDRALAGDMSAIKIILSYKIGKPVAAPNPDGIESDEWSRFEEAAVQHEQVQDLLTSLPSPLANDLVRTTWQVKAAAFAENLGRQLMPQGLADAECPATNAQPLSQPSAAAALPSRTKKAPIANGESTAAAAQKNTSTDNQPPLPNGESTVSAAKKHPSTGNQSPLPNGELTVSTGRTPPSTRERAPLPNCESTVSAGKTPHSRSGKAPLSNGDSAPTTIRKVRRTPAVA